MEMSQRCGMCGTPVKGGEIYCHACGGMLMSSTKGNAEPRTRGVPPGNEPMAEMKMSKPPAKRDIEISESADPSVELEMKNLTLHDVKTIEKRLASKETSLSEREASFVNREQEFNRVVESWTKRVNEFEERVKNLEQRETELSVSIDGKDKYLADLNHRIAEGEKQIMTVQEEIARVESEQHDKSMAIDELKADTSIKERRIKELDHVMSDLGSVVEDLQARIKDDRHSLSVIEADIRSAEKAYEDRKDLMKKVTVEVNEKRKHGEKLEEMIVEHEEEIEELVKEIEKLKKTKGELQQKK